MDNRTLDRHIIPNGKVYIRKLYGIGFLSRYKGPYNLSDLSKSSLRFEQNSLNMNDVIVELKIVVPGFNNVKIKGKVAGSNRTPDYPEDYTIIQFLPFGSRKIYNTYRSKQKLEAIIDEYSN